MDVERPITEGKINANPPQWRIPLPILAGLMGFTWEEFVQMLTTKDQRED
jgi:hypothetical protein